MLVGRAHQHSSHKDWPFNNRKGNVVKDECKSALFVLEHSPESDVDVISAVSSDAVSNVDSVNDASSDMFISDTAWQHVFLYT